MAALSLRGFETHDDTDRQCLFAFNPDSSTHVLGVLCGLTAGVWLGAAEAPTKLVHAGFSPFAISLCMVAGVFTARWTFPTLLKGTSYVFADLMCRKHLLVWALLAGALWAVANTLTVLRSAMSASPSPFLCGTPIRSSDCCGGVLLFRELDGADAPNDHRRSVAEPFASLWQRSC